LPAVLSYVAGFDMPQNSGPLAKAASAALTAPPPAMRGAKVFVGFVFLLLAAAFVASTFALVSEFWDHGWAAMLVTDSHLFIFFPTFGLLALLAFFHPSVIFTHLYWTHLRLGRFRFVMGTVVVLVLTALVNQFMLGPTSSPRAIWEIAPRALDADRGEPANCMTGRTGCTRGAILPVLESLREKAQTRGQLSRFARPCTPDPLLEPPEAQAKLRWCFPANRLMNAGDCCTVQRAFMTTVAERVSNASSSSRLAIVDRLFQAMKIFFILVVLVIGIMLVVWRNQVDTHYPHLAARVERNVLVGGVAMLLWPLMDYASLDASNVLYGKLTEGLQFRLSLVVAPWSLLILFYFLRRFARNVEVLGQIGGVAGGLGAVLVRDELKDWAVRYLGVGMPSWMFVVLAGLWCVGIIALLWPVTDRPLESYPD
jgi:hypothetical protein